MVIFDLFSTIIFLPVYQTTMDKIYGSWIVHLFREIQKACLEKTLLFVRDFVAFLKRIYGTIGKRHDNSIYRPTGLLENDQMSQKSMHVL